MNLCVPLKTCITPKNCAIPSAHKRLEAVHRAWHEAQANYHNADAFTIAFNNAIQGLRNVTFALQSALRNKAKGFDEWYSRWQTVLRNDEASRWSVEARNLITKVGDLNAKSSVRIWELRTYDDVSAFHAQKMMRKPPDMHARIPILSSRSIYEDVVAQEQTNSNPLQAVGLERRWEIDSLPDWELLDAVSHCFTLLCSVILDAELTLIPASLGKPPFPIPAENIDALSRPQCMEPNESDRLTIISAEDGAPRSQQRHRIERDEEIIAQLPERYGPLPEIPHNISSPLELVDLFTKTAKRILAVDGEHARFTYFFKGGKMIHGETPFLADRTDKYLHALDQAEIVRSIGADGYLEVAEAWHLERLAKLDPSLPGIAEHPHRKEVLIVTACTSNNRFLAKMTPFERNAFGLAFKEALVLESPPNYLMPMFHVWAEMRRDR